MRLFIFSVSTTTPNGPAFQFSSCVLATDFENAETLADQRAIELLPELDPLEIITGDFLPLWEADSVPEQFIMQLSESEQAIVRSARDAELHSRAQHVLAMFGENPEHVANAIGQRVAEQVSPMFQELADSMRDSFNEIGAQLIQIQGIKNASL